MKPVREFNGTEGQASTGVGGPDQIELDLDKLMVMMDPLAEHVDTSDGGIGTENIQPDAANDTITGERTIDQAIATATANTGTLTQLLSWVAKALKGATGLTNWYDAPTRTLEDVNGVLNSHTGSSSNPHSVTAAQAGAYTTAQVDSAVEVPQGDIDTHVGLTNNPHSVTASQAGAYSTAETKSSVELASQTGTAGTDIVGGRSFLGIAAGTLYVQLTALKTAIDDIIAGVVPDVSIDNDKLATDVKVGSLAALLTTVKTNVVAAINELFNSIATKATTETYSATVTTSWTGSVAPYTQIIVVTDMLSTDNPVVDVVLDAVYATALLERDAYSKIEKILTDTDEITVYSDEVTTQAFDIQLKVVR